MQAVQFTINEDQASVVAHFEGQHLVLSALWLRERCQDDIHLDPVTQQRLFDPHQLADDLALLSIEKQGEQQYRMTFSDGYEGTYDINEFYADFDIYDGAPAPKLWKNGFDTSKFHINFDDIFTDEGLLQGIDKFLTYGVLIVDQVPTEKGSAVKVASRFGHVRRANA